MERTSCLVWLAKRDTGNALHTRARRFPCPRFGIIVVTETVESTWIAGPHILFGHTFRNQFCEPFPGAASLRDATREETSFKRVLHAGHWTNQRIAIRRIWYWAIDDLAQSCFAHHGRSFHRIVKVPFQPLAIIRVELEQKVVRYGIISCRLTRFAITPLRAQVHPILLLAKIV